MQSSRVNMVSTRKSCGVCGSIFETVDHYCPNDGSELIVSLEDEPVFKDKYEFLGIIGSGGMGVIYKARQKLLNKYVAIKMMHAHLISEVGIKRFQLEGKATSKLKHKSIIALNEFGITESGQPFMVMDYVEGRTLAQVLEVHGPLSLMRFLQIFIPICDALAHAHSLSILHRDIKPSNIMLIGDEGKEEVRLMDFGIAKVLDESSADSGQLTRTGESIGSPLYMSPEQVRGGKIDQRSDLYSLGCVMYEALTGTTPFVARSALELMMLHMNENEKPLTLSQAMFGTKEFDVNVERIVFKLLEKDTKERYQAAEQVRNALIEMQDCFARGEKFQPAIEAQVTGRRWSIRAIAAILALTVISLTTVVASFYLGKKMAPPKPMLRTLTQVKLAKLIASKVKEIDISQIDTDLVSVTDEDLAPLEHGKDVTSLLLSNTPITDSGLEHVRKLQLTKLDASKTNVRTLHGLVSVNSLKHLDLAQTAVDSSGMAVIGQLADLQTLSLRSTGIHDADLACLTSLRNLRLLDLTQCSHVSDAAERRLVHEMPWCSITFSPVEDRRVILSKMSF